MAALVDSVASKTGSGMCLDFTTSDVQTGAQSQTPEKKELQKFSYMIKLRAIKLAPSGRSVHTEVQLPCLKGRTRHPQGSAAEEVESHAASHASAGVPMKKLRDEVRNRHGQSKFSAQPESLTPLSVTTSLSFNYTVHLQHLPDKGMQRFECPQIGECSHLYTPFF